MHLKELCQYIEQNRREFIARRAEKGFFTDSAVEAFPPGENKGGQSAENETEAVLAEAKAD